MLFTKTSIKLQLPTLLQTYRIYNERGVSTFDFFQNEEFFISLDELDELDRITHA